MPAPGSGGGFADEGFEDLFANIFEQRGTRGGPARGQDMRYVLQATFLDAVNGATSRLTLPDGQTLDVKIPPGTQEGDVLRLRGRGQPGRQGGPAGDALIEIHITPHRFYRREGQDIFLDLPVSLSEAVLGAKVQGADPARAGGDDAETPYRRRHRIAAARPRRAGARQAAGRRPLCEAARGHRPDRRKTRNLSAHMDTARLRPPRRDGGSRMMVTLERLRVEIRGLDEAELERWIGASLVRAEGVAGARLFEEIDVARIRLIFELRHELDIEEPALPVVLSLMDQLYDLRRRGAQLNAALAELPADVRQAILRRLG